MQCGKVGLAIVVVMNLQTGRKAELQHEETQQKVVRRGVSTRASMRDAESKASSEQQPLPSTHSRALPSQPREEVTGSAPAQDNKPAFRTAAVDAAGSTSRMQRWEGDSLVGSVTNAAHDSMMQPATQHGFAHTASMADDSTLRQGAGVQPGQVGGVKLSRKRLAEEIDVQPTAKRWQVDGSLTGVGKTNNLWGIASAARGLGVGSNGMAVAQAELGTAEGAMALHFNSVLNRAAVGQQYMRKDEWGHV